MSELQQTLDELQQVRRRQSRNTPEVQSAKPHSKEPPIWQLRTDHNRAKKPAGRIFQHIWFWAGVLFVLQAIGFSIVMWW